MDRPLMPKATAVWLVDNTTLTFEQIAKFCGLHALEVKGIADGEVGAGIRGLDPVSGGQLERSEIERCEKDSSAELKPPSARRCRHQAAQAQDAALHAAFQAPGPAGRHRLALAQSIPSSLISRFASFSAPPRTR